MKEDGDGFSRSPVNRRRAALKAGALLVFVIAALLMVRYAMVNGLLNTDELGVLLERAGLWGPLLYIAVFIAGVCLFVPGTVLMTLGAVVFGPYQGFVYAWTGAFLGAVVSFLIGRYLGRDFAASLVGDRLKKYDDGIEREGFATVLYLRLICFPYSPLNFGMGLTKIRFRDYCLATALGIVIAIFSFTFVVGTVKEVWASGQWGELISWKIFGSVALIVFSFCIPKIIDKVKGSPGLKVA